MIEIERKFLIKGNFKDEAYEALRIKQGYIVTNDNGRSVRIRIKGEKAFITIKGGGSKNGVSRFEWEKEISISEANQLLELCNVGVIDKTRYLIKGENENHTFEVDVFYGENEGLVMAELELSSENEPFAKPAWLGEEVTGDKRYYNAYLSEHPFKSWK